MTAKTMNTCHTKTKVNPLLDWYQRTTGNLVDRMCCVSYASQVDDGEQPVEYDEMRAKMVVPDWIQDYQHDTEQQRASKHHTSKEHGPGHLTLQGDADDSMGKCFFSPCSPAGARSDATATTVSMSTVRTARTLASESTLNASNRSGGGVVVDDIIYVRSDSLDDQAIRSPREIELPPASRYRRYRSEDDRRESPPPLRAVPTDALPNLPYLSLTEGYEC